MAAKAITEPHRFVVITDDVPAMQAAGLEAFPIWSVPDIPEHAGPWLRNYMRLGLFDLSIGGQIGERILSIDLDAIIRGNIDDLIPRPGTCFQILSLKCRQQLQGGLFYVEPGYAYPNPWGLLLDDANSNIVARSRKWVGSDQAILSELFYAQVADGRIPSWSEHDGVVLNTEGLAQHDWRIFFRTGHRKCWEHGVPERAAYFEASGMDESTCPAHTAWAGELSGRTPGGLSTRVARYLRKGGRPRG